MFALHTWVIALVFGKVFQISVKCCDYINTYSTYCTKDITNTSLDFCSNNRKIQNEYQEQVSSNEIHCYCKKVPNEKSMLVLSEYLTLH